MQQGGVRPLASHVPSLTGLLRRRRSAHAGSRGHTARGRHRRGVAALDASELLLVELVRHLIACGHHMLVHGHMVHWLFRHRLCGGRR